MKAGEIQRGHLDSGILFGNPGCQSCEAERQRG